MSAIIGKKVGHDPDLPRGRHGRPGDGARGGSLPGDRGFARADRDGYDAIQLAFGEVKEAKLTKAELGHLKKAGAAPLRHLVEFRDVDLPAPEGVETRTRRDDAGPRTVGPEDW